MSAEKKKLTDIEKKRIIWKQLQNHLKFKTENIELNKIIYAKAHERIRNASLSNFEKVVTYIENEFKGMPKPRQIIEIFDRVEKFTPKEEEIDENLESFRESRIKFFEGNRWMFMKYFSNSDQYDAMLRALKTATCSIRDEDVICSIQGEYLSEEAKRFFERDKDSYSIINN